MGRKSLVDVRREQIVAAARKTIASVGLSGATQELIAQEAGMSRTHLRHYVGSRAELVELVWVETMETYLHALESARAQVANERRFEYILDFMFGPGFVRNDDDAVIEAYFTAAQIDRELSERITKTYELMVDSISSTLQVAYDLSLRAANNAAYALLCLAMGYSSMGSMPVTHGGPEWLRSAAEGIVDRAVSEKL